MSHTYARTDVEGHVRAGRRFHLEHTGQDYFQPVTAKDFAALVMELHPEVAAVTVEDRPGHVAFEIDGPADVLDDVRGTLEANKPITLAITVT